MKESAMIKGEEVNLHMKWVAFQSTLFCIFLLVVTSFFCYALWGYITPSDYGVTDTMTYHEAEIFFAKRLLWFFVLILAGIVMHELIHGLVGAWFAPQHFKNIKFGVSFTNLNIMPYCHCNAPMRVDHFRIVALAPLCILGIIPYFIGLFCHSFSLLAFGLFLIFGAFADIAIVWKTRGMSSRQIILDHPTKPGFIILEQPAL